MITSVQGIVNAIIKIAECNHYMICLDTSLICMSDLEDAEQELIARENRKELKRSDICFLVLSQAKERFLNK